MMSVHLKHMSHLDTSDNLRVSSQQHRAQRTTHNISPTHSLLAVEGKREAHEGGRRYLRRIVRFQHPTAMNMAQALSRAHKCHRENKTARNLHWRMRKPTTKLSKFEKSDRRCPKLKGKKESWTERGKTLGPAVIIQ